MALVSRATLRRRAGIRRGALRRAGAPSLGAASSTAEPVQQHAPSSRSRQKGQGLAEFALILLPLSLMLLGIIQMGIIFNGYVTLANATREGAREASIYFYDRTKSKAANDSARAAAARTALKSAMGVLPIGSPWLTDADIVISYSLPSGIPESDPRRGQYVTLRATYKMDLIIPLIAGLLPRDANGRMPISSETTMTVN